MDPIRGVGPLLHRTPVEAARPEASSQRSSFAETMGAMLGEANQLLGSAERAAADLATGKVDSVEALVALTKADLALRHIATLRNRAIEAYQEIMRLPL